MNTTQNSATDSTIVRAYDEAILRAQVDPDQSADPQIGAMNGPAGTTVDPDGEAVYDLTHTTGRGVPENDFGPGDDLRDREFPVPADRTGGTDQRVTVDQNGPPDKTMPSTGPAGSMIGDRQFGATVPSVMDQQDAQPDLVQEQR